MCQSTDACECQEELAMNVPKTYDNCQEHASALQTNPERVSYRHIHRKTHGYGYRSLSKLCSSLFQVFSSLNKTRKCKGACVACPRNLKDIATPKMPASCQR